MMHAAIYCRISDDKRGERLGVQRQEELCRNLATQLGVGVSKVYSDNSISAYSGKPRPEFMQMVEDAKDGKFESIVVWQLDRLYRNMRELEDYIDLIEVTGIMTQTVMAGKFDLNQAVGRAMARAVVSFAILEVENSRDRVLAAKLQAAKAGLTSGGNRPYGYEQNGMIIIEREAAIIREVISRFIRGDSWRTIALDLNARAIPTAKGGLWTSINVRNVAVRPRNIAIRVHNDDQYPAQWPALISQDTWDDLHIAIKRGQSLYGKRTHARKHLLTGFVFCGLCGNKMNIINAQKADGSYSPAFSCRKIDVHGNPTGCGKVKRKKDPVEALIIDCIMYRLDSPELGQLLSQSETATPELKQLLRDHEAQQQRLSEILSLYSTGEMDFAEYKSAKTSAQARLEALGRELDRKSSKATMANVPAGQTVREAWDKADLMWRRQLVDVLIDKVLIYPKQPGDGKVHFKQWRFNPERIQIQWKV